MQAETSFAEAAAVTTATPTPSLQSISLRHARTMGGGEGAGNRPDGTADLFTGDNSLYVLTPKLALSTSMIPTTVVEPPADAEADGGGSGSGSGSDSGDLATIGNNAAAGGAAGAGASCSLEPVAADGLLSAEVGVERDEGDGDGPDIGGSTAAAVVEKGDRDSQADPNDAAALLSTLQIAGLPPGLAPSASAGQSYSARAAAATQIGKWGSHLLCTQGQSFSQRLGAVTQSGTRGSPSLCREGFSAGQSLGETRAAVTGSPIQGKRKPQGEEKSPCRRNAQESGSRISLPVGM